MITSVQQLRDLARHCDDQLTALALPDALARAGISRIREGLGGSHTAVTYPPLDALQPMAASDVLSRATTTRGVHLYAHVPYCEYPCPFCHYATKVAPLGGESQPVHDYLDALHHEIDVWFEHIAGSTIQSIYVGGGTPTVLPASLLASLLDRLIALPAEAGRRACLETSPITTVAADGEAKLHAAVLAGFDRISIGVQTFDEHLLRRNRGHGADVAIRAVEIASRCGVELNVDLIQDLEHQTLEHLIVDVMRIDELQPDQVTWYLLRLHEGSSLFRSRNDLELPDRAESIRRRFFLQAAMASIGYMATPGGRFVRRRTLRDIFKEVRAGVLPPMLGFGASAYSRVFSTFFRCGDGRRGISAYIERVREHGVGIDSGMFLDRREFVAGQLVSGIRGGVQLPEPTAETADYLGNARQILKRLASAGLAEQDDRGRWTLSTTGQLVEEEICSLFYTREVSERLAGRYWNRARLPIYSGGADGG